jgi:cytoskeletal protein RodZ
MMLHTCKVTCSALIIVVVTILMLGYSSVFAFPFQTTTNHHHKILDKKQVSSSSSSSLADDSSSRSSSDAKGNSNNNNKNNNQGTNDRSNTGSDNNLQSAETDQKQQGGRENVAPTDTSTPTPTPQTACEQGSNCTDQQGLSDRDRSSTTSSAGTSGEDNNTPFVLPFP